MTGKTLTLRLGTEVHEQLKLIAEVQGRSLTSVVADAIAEHLVVHRASVEAGRAGRAAVLAALIKNSP